VASGLSGAGSAEKPGGSHPGPDGFPYYLAWATIIQGWALTEQGQDAEGLAQMHQGLADLQATGAEVRLPLYLAMLAEGYGKTAQSDKGLSLLEQALTQAHRKEEYWRDAEIYRLRGEILLLQAGQERQWQEAEEHFRLALEVARRQQARSLELRAAMSLGRLWQLQGKRAAAHDILAAIYGWFTEGFDTPDLQEARALLEALQQG
jgi:predicted ATPase